VRTGKLELSNPPGFGETSMLTVEQAEIRARLLPLFRKQFEVDTVVLQKPVVHLVVAGDGTTNWQDLFEPASPGSPAADPSDAAIALAVQGLDLKAGKLIWEDRRSDSTVVFDDIDLAVGEVLSQKPVDVSVKFVAHSKQLDRAVDLQMTGLLKLDMDNGNLTLSQAKVQSKYGSTAQLDVQFGTLTYGLNQATVAVRNLAVDAEYQAPEIDGSLVAQIKTSLTADLDKGIFDIGETTILASYGSTGKAEVRFGSLRYDLGQSTIRTDSLGITGNYSDETLEQPLSLEAKARLSADLNLNRYEFANGQMHLGYGTDGNAEARFQSALYDFARSSVEVKGLEIDGAYSGPASEQPLVATLKTDAGVRIADELILLTNSKIQANYGSVAKADVGIEELQFHLGRSTLAIDGVKLDGSYTAPELEQPVAVTMNGGVTANLNDGIVELVAATGQADYGPLGKIEFAADKIRFDQPRYLIDARMLKLDGSYGQHEFRSRFPELSVDVTQQHFSAPEIDATIDGIAATAKLDLSNFLGEAEYAGELQISEFVPSDLFKRLDIKFESKDPRAFGKAELSTVFSGSLRNIRLDDLKLRLDDTIGRGFVEVEDFDQPKYRFDLEIDNVDIDRYTPKGDDSAETGAAIIVLPVGLFRGLDVNGQLNIARLKVAGVNTSDIVIGVISTIDGMTIRPLNAEMYGGTLEGEIKFSQDLDKDQGRGEARLVVQQTVENVDIGPLLADTGVTDRITGKGRFDLNIETTEFEGESRTKGVAGFHFFDGAIRGLDLRKIYLQARQIYNQHKGREQIVETDDAKEFRFTEMSGTLVFDERVAQNDDLNVKSPLFRIQGRGQADLVANELDYLLLATIVESARGQGGEELSDLEGVTLPIRVSGSLQAPVYKLDVAEILKLALRQQVRKEQKKLEQKLEKKIEEKLGEELLKLFRKE
jgi:AsmA protein